MSQARERLNKINGKGQRKTAREGEGQSNTVPTNASKETLEALAKQHNIDLPKNWNNYSKSSRLDYIASRILANNRTTTKHDEIKEEGYLSPVQYKRRLLREVYHNPPKTSGSELPYEWAELNRGVFGRKDVPEIRKKYRYGHD